MTTDRFELVSPFQPTGDQPEAIDALVKSIEAGNRMQTLKAVYELPVELPEEVGE